MKRDFLVSLGLTDDVIDKIMSENGKDIENIKSKYSDYDDLKSQLADAQKQLDGFKAIDIDGLKRSAEEWQAKAIKAEEDAKATLNKVKFDFALDNALTGAKARNLKAVKALLDVDSLKYEGDKIVGLDEQLQSLRDSAGYLFEGDDTPPAPKFTGATNTPPQDDMAAVRAALGLPVAK